MRAWPVLLGFRNRWDGRKSRQDVACSLFPEMSTGVSSVQLIKVRSDCKSEVRSLKGSVLVLLN